MFDKNSVIKHRTMDPACQNNKEEPAQILIAGGGIVGLVLAMSIRKQLGILPEVYEKGPEIWTEAGAGLGMVS